MASLYLLARLAGRDIAIPAEHVESVVRVSHVVPVPAVSPHISGLFALRSRVLTLVDCHWLVEGRKRQIESEQLAIVVTIDGHLYGLLVDAVQDIIAIEDKPLPVTGNIGSGWDAIGNQMVSIADTQLTLVLDAARVVNPALANAA
ncbi:chemotaxis protein CheW [Alterisphingorhabdus coralli]|uniref:Chemotaxis protein CheW n=1 Tax=Alterisphingorhabdus coralli TaxID=3071408 RepID=A0AA97F9L7_9SPHN|nr:chemotaxis protein CheW [Parasphingorhabdus sp. SCSIO 66989]WOE76456.1 chemotaxis protein CheW [Parasphingorhabdus sp. SCSIO 66989]